MKRFFPVVNSHFGRAKTNFSGYEKYKVQKRKKKKKKKKKEKKKERKRSSPYLVTSPLPFLIFPFPFWIFLLFFSIFPFFLASLFLVLGQQKLKSWEVLRGTLPPCTLLLHHCVKPLFTRYHTTMAQCILGNNEKVYNTTQKHYLPGT